MELAIRPAVEPVSIDKRFQQERAMTDLCDLTASKLRRMIGRKDISPIELIESCIDRIESVDGQLNAMVTKSYERARAEARDAEQAVVDGDELGLSFFNEGGNMVESKLKMNWLWSDMLGLVTSLSGLSLRLESVLLDRPSLWCILAEELEKLNKFSTAILADKELATSLYGR